jgi:hypothetical protein
VVWPFFELRIRCGDVLVRGVADDHLEVLQLVVPDDLEMNPVNERIPTLPADIQASATDRGHVAARGTWSVDSWCLDLAVEVDGRVVGVQAHRPAARRDAMTTGLLGMSAQTISK